MATKFVSEINSHLKCPKCKELFSEPVINIHCGHTLCKNCFVGGDNSAESVKTNQKMCPVDSVACSVDSLVINRALLSQIHDLLIYCKHGLTFSEQIHDWIIDEGGCPEQIKLGERELHETECEFALVACPFNAGHCGQFRKKDLQHHTDTCTNVACPHNNKGCNFLSSYEMAKSHAETCGYRSQQSLPDFTMLLTLQEQNSSLELVVESLKHEICALQEKNKVLDDQVSQQSKTIKTLVEKVDRVTEDVSKLKQVRRVPSLDSTQSSVTPRRTTSSSSVTSVAHGSHSPRHESWKMPFQFKCIGTLRGHQEAVRSLVTKKNLLFSCGDDKLIKVWDLEALTKGCVKTLSAHKDCVQALAVSDDHLYSGSHDGCLAVWSIADLCQVKAIEDAHNNLIAALACSEEFLLSSSHTMIKIWQPSSLELVHCIKGLHHWVRSLAFSKDQDKFYSASHNTIDIWDCTGTYNLVGKITHTFGSVYSLTVTRKHIIAGTYNQNIHMFDTNTNKYLRKLSGHIDVVRCVLTSVSGRFLFTASKDSSIQIWNLENNLPTQNLQRHEGGVNSLVIHNDLLLSGADDSEIKVYKYFKMNEGFTPS